LEGEKLVQHPDYCAYIEQKLVDETFEGREAIEGICHICGSRGRVTSDTTRFKLLKFYITDKPGFASGLRKRGFLRNYTLCKGCYRALLAGERFVDNELRTRLGRSAVYPIPTFHAPEAYPTVDTVAKWAEYLKARLSASETLEKWHAFQQELEKYQLFERIKGAFVLNLFFATKGQAAVKVDKLIANVPPSRLDWLDEVRNAVRDWAGEHLGRDTRGEWDLSLGKLFYLLPLRQRDRQAETKPYLELLDALLTGRPLSARELIAQLLETACIHRFERYEAYVHTRPPDPERTLVEFMLQSQLFLHYLRKLEQLQNHKGGEVLTMVSSEAVEVERNGVDEATRAWMEGLGLVGARRGLFLLGVLIGKIGSTREQRDSGKPILNKVHFQGMDRNKLLRLANEVYEKLRQYKIVDYNEGLYAAMKAYLDRALGANELGSPQENVYWVLSGYAYATHQAIRAGKQRREAEAQREEEKDEEVSV
ncbi:MAG TPA: TIGR02556 family CRISPR-associated protein, partial [Anaerolineales bacterium]|nr:TIGR02556 family CRISPR-associated protein [Anaerolineales bacterium]